MISVISSSTDSDDKLEMPRQLKGNVMPKDGSANNTSLALVIAIAVAGLTGTVSAVANIIGADDRRVIDTFDLSADERAAMYNSIGLLVCRWADITKESNAFLAGEGKAIVTTAHGFLKAIASVDPRDQPRCMFSTKQAPQKRMGVNISKAIYGTTRPNSDRSRDWAVVPLRHPLASTRIPKFGDLPIPLEEVLMVTVSGDGTNLDPSKLVGRTCMVRASFPGNEAQHSSFLSDCDNVSGDSGGVYFSRRDGVLELVGLHESGGYDAANGLQYDVATKDRHKGSYAMGLGFDGKLREALERQ
jgi:hypothetical protein